MKKYTFTFPKSTNNTLNEYTNCSKIIDDIILSNIKKNNPYLFESDTTNSLKNREINIDITIPKNKKLNVSIRSGAFKKYINMFLNNKNNIIEDDYDFLLSDGTPVKLFSDEIQIGYDIIPLNNFTLALYNKLSKEQRNKITEIYIYIKKHTC